MKAVLILENQKTETCAYLGTWLKKHKIPFVICNRTREDFPDSITAYSALAVMGGAMSANELSMHNKQAEILILQAMYRDKPVIGHCLGGQLMAKALGAKVNVAHTPEIGWQPISYSEHLLSKQWFGSNPTNHVIQWHYDTFELPSGATLLASSEACGTQAFSIGKHLAMQFHIEMDIPKAKFWASEADTEWENAQKNHTATVQTKDQIINGIDQYIIEHQKTADNIYRNWMRNSEYADLFNY